jgi:hypothetical protein
MYYKGINKNLVHQFGDQTKVIPRCTVNQPSRPKEMLTFIMYCCVRNCPHDTDDKVKAVAMGKSLMFVLGLLRSIRIPCTLCKHTVLILHVNNRVSVIGTTVP